MQKDQQPTDQVQPQHMFCLARECFMDADYYFNLKKTKAKNWSLYKNVSFWFLLKRS